MSLKSSYVPVKSFREVYTGGPVAFEPATGCIVCSQGKKVNLLHAETGDLKHTIEGDGSPVSAVSCVNGRVVIAYDSDQVIVYSFSEEKWEIYSQWKCKKVQNLAWDPTQTMVACACSDGTVKIFNVKGKYCTHNFVGHVGVVTLCWFLPLADTFVLISTGQDCEIRMWDLFEKKCVGVLKNHLSIVTGFDLLNNQILVSVGRDKIIALWDLSKKALISTIPVYEEIESLVTIPNTLKKKGARKLVVIGGRKGAIRVWDTEDRKEVWAQAPSQQDTKEEEVIDFLLLAGDRLISVTSIQNILIHTNTLPFQLRKTIVGWNDEILGVTFVDSARGQGSDLILATNSSSLRVMSLQTNSWEIIPAHSDTVLSVSVNHDNGMLATSSKDGEIKVWSIESVDDDDEENADGIGIRLKILGAATGHLSSVTSVAWPHKTNHFLVSASEDTTLKLWDLKNIRKSTTFSTLAGIKAHEKEINSVVVGPDDSTIATASLDKTVKIWKRRDEAPYLSLMGTLTGHKRGVWDVSFSPVDKVVATSAGDDTIKIWSLTDFSCLRTLEGHSGSVLQVSFLEPQGLQLLSAGSDGLLKLWSAKDSECLSSMENHEDKIWSMSILRDKKASRVVTVGADSCITLWEDHTQQEKDTKREKEHTLLLSSQQLTNLIRNKSYKAAVHLALSLDQPRQLLSILKSVVLLIKDGQQLPFENQNSEFEEADDTHKGGKVLLHEIILSLNSENLSKLLIYLRDWNTNSKTAIIVQQILVFILEIYSASSLAKLPRMKEVIRAILPYTDRQQSQMARLLQESYILDYTLAQMSLSALSLQPTVAVDASEKKPEVPTSSAVPVVEKRIDSKRERGDLQEVRSKKKRQLEQF